jgi:hypothetical protein
VTKPQLYICYNLLKLENEPFLTKFTRAPRWLRAAGGLSR